MKRKLFYYITTCTVLLSSSFGGVVFAKELTKAQLRAMGIYFVLPGSGNASTSVSGSVDGSSACYELALPQISDLAALAKAIDDHIREKAPTSPFIGLGGDIVAGAVRQGVNPLFVVGNMRMESIYGTTGTSGHATLATQLHQAFNAFGRTAGSASKPHFTAANGRLWYKYPSWKESVNSPTASPSNTTDQPSLMRAVYLDDGLNTIGQYLGRYAPASDGNDESVYGKVMKDVIGSIVTLAGASISCGDDTTVITPPPPSSDQPTTTPGGQTNVPQ